MARAKIAILSGRTIIHDDQPPHIDQYGLAMIESLQFRLERLLADEDDPVRARSLDAMRAHVTEIVGRYEE